MPLIAEGTFVVFLVLFLLRHTASDILKYFLNGEYSKFDEKERFRFAEEDPVLLHPGVVSGDDNTGVCGAFKTSVVAGVFLSVEERVAGAFLSLEEDWFTAAEDCMFVSTEAAPPLLLPGLRTAVGVDVLGSF